MQEKPRKTLEDRVEELERRVAALERGDLILLDVEQLPSLDSKPGPRPKVLDSELRRRRDEIVWWIEQVWPQLGGRLMSAKRTGLVNTMEAALDDVSLPGDYHNPAKDRIRNGAADLLAFLRSEKFLIRPPAERLRKAVSLQRYPNEWAMAAMRLPSRQIANAMAGLPELSWRRSFDRLSRVVCEIEVPQLLVEYLLPAVATRASRIGKGKKKL